METWVIFDRKTDFRRLAALLTARARLDAQPLPDDLEEPWTPPCS